MGIVLRELLLINTSASGNSFQVFRKVRMALVDNTGLHMGITMANMVCRKELPSIHAASSISMGTLATELSTRNTATGRANAI